MREFLLMAAVFSPWAVFPWAAFGGMLHGFAAVLERKGTGRRMLLRLLAVTALSGGGLFFAPYGLRQLGLEFRCLPRLMLIGVFYLSCAGMILGIMVLFFRQGKKRWWERGGVLLSGAVLLVVCLYSAFIFTVLTVQSEKIGFWEGEKAVMIAVEGCDGMFRCHQYRGLVVMGRYLGTVFPS